MLEEEAMNSPPIVSIRTISLRHSVAFTHFVDLQN